MSDSQPAVCGKDAGDTAQRSDASAEGAALDACKAAEAGRSGNRGRLHCSVEATSPIGSDGGAMGPFNSQARATPGTTMADAQQAGDGHASARLVAAQLDQSERSAASVAAVLEDAAATFAEVRARCSCVHLSLISD